MNYDIENEQFKSRHYKWNWVQYSFACVGTVSFVNFMKYPIFQYYGAVCPFCSHLHLWNLFAHLKTPAFRPKILYYYLIEVARNKALFAQTNCRFGISDIDFVGL